MATKKIIRLPYRVESFIRDTGFQVIQLLPIDIPSHWESTPFGVHEDIAKFIHENCNCYNCGAEISKDLNKCDCNDPSIDPYVEVSYHLQARFSRVIHGAKFDQIWQIEKMRQKRELRLKRITANGGKHTAKDVRTLYDLQMGVCFYCGTSFSVNSKKNYQVDHRIPVVDGGRDDIANLVLACPSCNGIKLNNYWDDSVMFCTDRDMRKKLRLIRKIRNDYLVLHGFLPKDSFE